MRRPGTWTPLSRSNLIQKGPGRKSGRVPFILSNIYNVKGSLPCMRAEFLCLLEEKMKIDKKILETFGFSLAKIG